MQTNDSFKDLFKDSNLSNVDLKSNFIEAHTVSIHKHIHTMDLGFKTHLQFSENEVLDSRRYLYTEEEEYSKSNKSQRFRHSQLSLQKLETIEGEMLFNPTQFQLNLQAERYWKIITSGQYQSFKGIVLNSVNGGFSVGIAGIVAFLPKSLARLPLQNKKEYINELMTHYRYYKIVKITQNKNIRNLVVCLLPDHK
uniref:Ribosomal protein S1 n=1 Tax=Moramonas marocensis TaxID=1805496 RepID=A0A140F2H3_9EUKA|nr:ribosomal protein S1 [Moramonas marocensis]